MAKWFILGPILTRERAVSSVVEHQFHILGVVGSSPISPTLSNSHPKRRGYVPQALTTEWWTF